MAVRSGCGGFVQVAASEDTCHHVVVAADTHSVRKWEALASPFQVEGEGDILCYPCSVLIVIISPHWEHKT